MRASATGFRGALGYNVLVRSWPDKGRLAQEASHPQRAIFLVEAVG